MSKYCFNDALGNTHDKNMRSREKFLRFLECSGYKYILEGDKIIVDHYTNIYLERIEHIPDNVIFKNGASIYLNSLLEIPKGTEFRNYGDVNMGSIAIKDIPYGCLKNEGNLWAKGFYSKGWGIGKGIGKKIANGRILGIMIKQGVFNG